ncbi:MAG: type II toxin-antitoxin system HipA family toxin [Alphaproteobacteria bacterium]|nr:type II toxin-antitoxin system HipA family toxin [Alphaproteobacteria bacterium]
MTKSLDVHLYDKCVGHIVLLPGGNTLFTFDKSYEEDPYRPILSQNFFSPTGQLLGERRPIRTRLEPFFSNLLPEGYLRDYLALKNGVNPMREFDLIHALGEDLPGAVHLQTSKESLDYAALREESFPFSKFSYRFSLAGIQLKFSALMKKGGGLKIPPSGVGGNWIVKLPSLNFFHMPENEFAMMTLAESIGIQVPEFHLIPLGQIKGLPFFDLLQGDQAIIVKRFDRGPEQTRIHMEDFAQVYGIYPEQKYERVSYTNMAIRILTLCGEDGLIEYIRRLTFCILVGNGDMHLKNWSFLYPDGKTPVLSPAYDLLSTIPYLPEDSLALTFVNTKIMHQCTLALFEKFSEKAKVPKHLVLEVVKQTAETTREKWETVKTDINVPPQLIKAIDAHMTKISL